MKEKIKNSIVEEIKQDFRARQEARKCLETQWQLNMNFYMGNQFCTIGYGGEIEDYEKQFFWQEREVFNHIAPILEIRLAKLLKVKPKTIVLPASNDDSDLKTAKVSTKVLDSVSNRLNLSAKINEAMKWSEICGTSFYKIFWNPNIGQVIARSENGEEIRSGDVDISVCSPFEIFPDSDTCENVESCRSIIHARVYGKDEVKSMYGIDVKGENINVYAFDSVSGLGGLGYTATGTKIVEARKKDSVLVIEKYERPSVDRPNGRLVIIAGDHLVFDGDLPYENGAEGARVFPFVKQVSIEQAGSFWGNSVIDRLIPVQRAYNAVKNRKHEFLNRLSMGILKVEDGSIDIENLEDEGLCPGKILVYRQGSTPPSFLTEEEVPSSFDEEEQKLLDEFRNISGVTEVMDTDYVSSNLSGIALELMVEQDELRLTTSSTSIKNAIKRLAQQVLRLYRQFAVLPRLNRIVGDNGEVELFYFTKNDISSDDIAFETENELGETVAQKRQMVFELLNAGLLSDDNGNISKRMKSKILELLGLGIWENAQDLNDLHIKKAEKENFKLIEGKEVLPLDIDDDDLHISEHISFMLSDEFDKRVEKNKALQDLFLSHINLHKEHKKLNSQSEV